MNDTSPIDRLIEAARRELKDLEDKRCELMKRIAALEAEKGRANPNISLSHGMSSVTGLSPEIEKIRLFRSLFRGREDVFAKRFESVKTGKSGYQPRCRKEWIKGFCRRPAVKCADCPSRDFLPVTDDVIRSHLLGHDVTKRSRADYTVGVYPLLPDDTCWFLAVDFDKAHWTEDAIAYLETCSAFEIPAYLERSRSGNGGHVWMFFSEPLPASLARQLGAFMVTETMERRPEIGFESYDRFFPGQDTMPRGGFGNLIALPLQKNARDKGNSVFLDEYLVPMGDQWAFLSTIARVSPSQVEKVVKCAATRGGILGVPLVSTDEEDDAPWLEPPSRVRAARPISGPIPKHIELILGNQIYIEKAVLSPALKNRLIRLAAFQNPEFYKAQAMRFPTFDKPRIIHCGEDFPFHIGLPRGCLEEVMSLFKSLGIQPGWKDERFEGRLIRARFHGVLRPEQEKAAQAIMAHDTGVLSASTAFGKTVLAAYVIARRAVNTLVLVHRRQLLDQWLDRLKTFLEMDPKEIGHVGGGRRNRTGVIDVAIIQSLSQKGVVDDMVADYGHLVVDECHHLSARSFEIVARQSKAKFVTGLSATVVRKDGHHPIIFMNCGPIRYKVDDKKQAVKRPFAHKVLVRKTLFRLPHHWSGKERLAMHELYAALIGDEQRNRMIVQDVVQAVEAGRCPVLLTERREHLDMIASLLSSYIEHLFVMKGGMGKKQRQALAERIKEVPEDDPRVILATGRYLGEGFDDARLDTLFLTLPVSWKGVLAQYAGRLHRLHESKNKVLIYDYVDEQVPLLAKMFAKRWNGYHGIGYELEAP